MKYIVTITETLSRDIEIYADDRYDAIEAAKQLYDNAEVVLDADDFLDVVNIDFGFRRIRCQRVRIVTQAAYTHAPGGHEIINLSRVGLLEVRDVDVRNTGIPTRCLAFRPAHQLHAREIFLRCEINDFLK